MDPETLKILIAIGEHGGSVVLLVAVFIAGRATRAAAEAVETLKKIETGLNVGFAALRATAEATDKKLDAMHRDIQTLPIRAISAAAARR